MFFTMGIFSSLAAICSIGKASISRRSLSSSRGMTAPGS